jgi:hypothetical protein
MCENERITWLNGDFSGNGIGTVSTIGSTGSRIFVSTLFASGTLRAGFTVKRDNFSFVLFCP